MCQTQTIHVVCQTKSDTQYNNMQNDAGFAYKMYAKQNTKTPCSVHNQLI